MKRALLLVLVSTVVTTGSGCRLLRHIFCGPYWRYCGSYGGCAPWRDPGPDICEPCDQCGNWTGPGHGGGNYPGPAMMDSYGEGEVYYDGSYSEGPYYEGEMTYDPTYRSGYSGTRRHGTPTPAPRSRMAPRSTPAPESLPPPSMEGSQTRYLRQRRMARR